MYLINVEHCTLKRFDTRPPPYAILSHRWRDDEVSFQDFQDVGKRVKQKGFAKIVQMCALTQRNGLRWAWIDTCCIDKSSSAELSEAINSMFNWYRNSKVCYVYWDDVTARDGERYLDEVSASMPQCSSESDAQNVSSPKSEWFQRGWTLQELIAPYDIKFYNSKWNYLGNKRSLAVHLGRITRIGAGLLQGDRRLKDFSVATRMSWAAGRKTTREEDTAYCLLGLFDINMPLLYGEGSKAFIRLQEEIVKTIDDQTVFAWKEQPTFSLYREIFATQPKAFASSADQIVLPNLTMATEFDITARGLRTKATVCLTSDMETELDLPAFDSYLLLPLNCTSHLDFEERTSFFSAILLVRTHNGRYLRSRPHTLYKVHESQISRDTTVHIVREGGGALFPYPYPSSRPQSRLVPVEILIQLPDEGIVFINTSPIQGHYDQSRSLFHVDIPTMMTGSKFVFGLAFDVGHGAVILVTIEIIPALSKSSSRPYGCKITASLMSDGEDDTHLIDICKQKVVDLGTSTHITHIEPPINSVLIKDLIMPKTRKLITDRLRLCFKTMGETSWGLLYFLGLSFISSRSWASAGPSLEGPVKGLVGVQSAIGEKNG